MDTDIDRLIDQLADCPTCGGTGWLVTDSPWFPKPDGTRPCPQCNKETTT